ncbi:MAG: NAD+ synthase [Halothiobacillaceae bacterium]
MSNGLRIALAQVNIHVGDCRRNAERVIEQARRARDELGANLVVFPELTLTGYPPEDLLLREDFLEGCDRAIRHIAEALPDVAVLVGAPEKLPAGLFNSAILIENGRVRARYRKQQLPNYGVFDEKRYFTAGDGAVVAHLRGVPLGITICEDIWTPEAARIARSAGARILLNLNASPYHRDKPDERVAVVADRVRETGLPVVYVNLVGGQDELVFDGCSFVHEPGGVRLRLADFSEQIGWIDVDAQGRIAASSESSSWREGTAAVYEALTTGIRDYAAKNGFSGAVLGLSGGIDSALVLALAVDALGAENVLAVRMPSRYTSQMSLEDAELEAERLGVRIQTLPIEPAFAAFESLLNPLFAGTEVDATEENLQARIRGVLLMALSNKFGKILLATGNKSELAVGYATLYGDMAGGFAPIKDVPKTQVYALAKHRNALAGSAVIPERVITREPSAELRADQRDSDSLPPYPELDAILELFVEHDRPIAGIVEAGFDEETVRRVVRMILRNEYKRRQAAPGVRISARAFGRDRRYPITSGFSPWQY